MTKSGAYYEGIRKLESFDSAAGIDLEILSKLRFGVSECQNGGIFIFGVGKLGQKIYRFFSKHNIPVVGFVDNNSKFQGQKQNGIEVFSPAILKRDSIVYIASETFMNSIQKQLNDAGMEFVISHFQGSILFKSYPDFPADIFYRGMTEDLFSSREKYLEVFSLLNDDSSRDVFDKLVLYRLTGDIAHINAIASTSNPEYFDATVLTLGSFEVFFDCGAFDGDSAWNFITSTQGKFKSIHLFEPDKVLLGMAHKKLESFKNVHYNELGIFDRTATLHFDNTGGLDGSINDAGAVEIKTVSIDEYQTADIPTYLKFDIEGVEIEALNGARNVIAKHTPKLAIASYHYPRHLWQIPMLVFDISRKYSVHLRHYSNCIFGSTYYFLPR